MGIMTGYLDSLLDPTVLGYGMIAAALVTFPTLIFGPTAPYGRYSKTGWGMLINAKLAWFTQEMWSLVIPVIWIIFFATQEQLDRLASPANSILMGMFLFHYIYRDAIYPFRIRSGNPTPFTVWILALIFCVYNGYMQTKYLLEETVESSPLSIRFLLGACMWATGWLINFTSDNYLISLRQKKDGKKSYKIPRGGVFEYVSSANYFGEILEWMGFAVAAWSIPAAAFAVFTFANLAPRGWKHHKWYLRTFPAYPKTRRAVIPFIW